MIRERLGLFNRAALVAVPLFAVALTGCGDDDPVPIEQAQSTTVAPNKDATYPAYTYYANGTRWTDFENDGGALGGSFEWCEGADLVAQTTTYYNSGNSRERSVAHPACADGKLTPEDFKPIR
jgi:hypothetical protein